MGHTWALRVLRKVAGARPGLWHGEGAGYRSSLSCASLLPGEKQGAHKPKPSNHTDSSVGSSSRCRVMFTAGSSADGQGVAEAWAPAETHPQGGQISSWEGAKHARNPEVTAVPGEERLPVGERLFRRWGSGCQEGIWSCWIHPMLLGGEWGGDPQMTSEDDRDEEGVYQGDRRGWMELFVLRVPNKKRERIVEISPRSSSPMRLPQPGARQCASPWGMGRWGRAGTHPEDSQSGKWRTEGTMTLLQGVGSGGKPRELRAWGVSRGELPKGNVILSPIWPPSPSLPIGATKDRS